MSVGSRSSVHADAGGGRVLAGDESEGEGDGVVGERFWGVLGALMGQVERVCEKDGDKKKMKKSLNGGRGENVEASSLKGSGTKRKRGESDGECSGGPLGLESDA